MKLSSRLLKPRFIGSHFIGSHFIVIFVIVLFVFLGILWLTNKQRKIDKEGFDTPTADQTRALSANIQSAVNSQLSGAGIAPMDASTFTTAIDQMQSIITNENNASAAQRALNTSANDLALANMTNTTAPVFQSNTFFQGSKFGDGFCQRYGSTDTATLNNQCSALTAESCNQTDCCIYIGGTKCVAGNANGPAITTDANGGDIDFAYYSYKNTCYGSCGKGINNAANPCSAYVASDTNVSSQCLNRLWAQTECPNTHYMTPAVVDSLKDYSKAAIEEQMAIAKTEPNYAKCYGSNPANWPPACDGTTSSSYGLSKRCLTKLLNDAGCPNTKYVTSDFVTTNALKPKSAMQSQFTILNAGRDDASLTQCYGLNPVGWPDPCLGADGNDLPDTAKMFTSEVPLRCARTLWRQKLGCPNSDIINYWYSLTVKNNGTPPWIWTFKDYRDWLNDIGINQPNLLKNKYIGMCYGFNPNNGWPSVPPIMPDPCAGITWQSKMGDLSPDCKTRIANALPTVDVTDSRYSYYNSVKTALQGSNNQNSGLYSMGIADWSQGVQTFAHSQILGITTSGALMTLAVSPNAKALKEQYKTGKVKWTPVSNSREFISIRQLKNGQFIGIGADKHIYVMSSLTDPGSSVNVNNDITVIDIEPLMTGGFVGISFANNKLFTKATLNAPSVIVVNNDETLKMTNIIQLKIASNIQSLGYPRLGSFLVMDSYWREIFGKKNIATTTQVIWNHTRYYASVTELEDGTILGIDPDGYYLSVRMKDNWDWADEGSGNISFTDNPPPTPLKFLTTYSTYN